MIDPSDNTNFNLFRSQKRCRVLFSDQEPDEVSGAAEVRPSADEVVVRRRGRAVPAGRAAAARRPSADPRRPWRGGVDGHGAASGGGAADGEFGARGWRPERRRRRGQRVTGTFVKMKKNWNFSIEILKILKISNKFKFR